MPDQVRHDLLVACCKHNFISVSIRASTLPVWTYLPCWILEPAWCYLSLL